MCATSILIFSMRAEKDFHTYFFRFEVVAFVVSLRIVRSK